MRKHTHRWRERVRPEARRAGRPTTSGHSGARDAELRRLLEAAVRRLTESGERVHLRELYGGLVRQPAPSYYVGREHAMRMVLRVRRMDRAQGESLGHGKWVEISDRAEREMSRRPGLTLGEAVDRVLAAGRATSFFITGESARRSLGRGGTELLKVLRR